MTPVANPFGRRRFLGLGAAAVLAACSRANERNGGSGAATGSTTPVPSSTIGGPRLTDPPFGLGVASGDPDPAGVVLWTRLVGAELAGRAVPLVWEVAADERFTRLAATGRYEATADLGHAVHVVVEGLEPDRPYWFRFRTRDHESAVGRTRTAPAPDQVQPLRFATASCQEYQEGFYAAWRDAAESELDLIVFLGDYIYEHGASDDGVRRYEGPAVLTLDAYRARYATHRSDPQLQAAHASCPWVITWDDHEVSDNYADLVPGFALDGPQLDRAAFTARRAAAYQAWYEHMPARVEPPRGSDLRIHRTVDWGGLARLVVLDGRQYRSDQTCNPVDIGPMCDEMRRADVTMLGEEQHRWMERALDSSSAIWNLLANQTLFAPMAYTDAGVVQLDSWDGYPIVRRRVTQLLDDHGVRNPVVLTGDIHLAAALDVHVVPEDPSSEVVATELVTTSISSSSDSILRANADDIRARNPHLRWIDFDHRGYTRIGLDGDGLVAEMRVVDDPTTPDSPVRTATTLRVDPGRPGIAS